MISWQRAIAGPAAGAAAPARSTAAVRWLTAAAQTARPRQWPKNLLVFAAPLAGASQRGGKGLGYALAAAVAFIAASAAVYFVNDVIDAGRDRLHPVKRTRPVADGRLPAAHALMLAGLSAATAVTSAAWIGASQLAALIAAYLTFSLLYSLALKHLPLVELVFVASGFVFRALGGAVATHVPPSGWFLLVCSLGALTVAIAKRFTELAVLGDQAIGHRPVMRWYSVAGLRLSGRMATAVMIGAYLLWAYSERDVRMRAWHLASAIPLAAALVRFGRLVVRADGRPVEDLIVRDSAMAGCELAWLALFMLGL